MTDIQDYVPFGPSPEESHYRCSRCRGELWVNEAIIDLELVRAKFEETDTAGFMPLLGCPSCNQKTMEHTGIKSRPAGS